MDWTDPEAASLARMLSRSDREAFHTAITAAGTAVQSAIAGLRPTGGRWLNVRPDPVDFRDRAYVPGFVMLDHERQPPAWLEQLPVQDQKWLPTCTGMAVATAVDLIRLRIWSATGGVESAVPEPVSARMLYEMGRSHDEHPEDGLPGSSVRGVLRGFFHNGVCRHQEELDGPDEFRWKFTVDRAKDARKVLLGVYARLSHVLLDYQVALNELGAIVVSARIHDGWRAGDRLENGTITWTCKEEVQGGHAVVIVGYTAEGFLIRNSWGPDWSHYTAPDGTGWPGVALWSYRDWRQNVLDGWVLNLAPPAKYDARTVAGYFGAGGGSAQYGAQAPTRIAVNGHYLYFKDGRYNEAGTFYIGRESVAETARLLSETEDYDHLLIMVDGGLDPLDAMVARAAAGIEQLKADRIYPVFAWWREDVFALVAEVLEDRAKRLEARSGGLSAMTDRLLGAFARDFMPSIWRAFQGEAERGFCPEDRIRGAGWHAMTQLIDGATSNKRPLRLHFACHGTGAIWLAEGLRRLAERDKRARPGRKDALVATLSLVAPICPPEAFEGAALRKLWNIGARAQRPVALYTLSDQDEAADSVGAFRGSFLALARETYPRQAAGHGVGVVAGNRILGHAETAESLVNDTSSVWHMDCTSQRTDCARIGSACKSHRGLASDPDVMRHILGRIRTSTQEECG